MRRRFSIRWWMTLGLLMTAALGVANWPVTTRSGVNFVWSSKKISLYEKAIHFLSRDLQTRRLAQEVAGEASGSQEKLARLFSWTLQNVRPIPEEFPAMDDHLPNVFIRGYGTADQRTEAFALLASYSGLPAASVSLRADGFPRPLFLALVKTEGEVIPFDVENGLIFTNPRGGLASLEELQLDPGLVAAASRGLRFHGAPYEAYFLKWKDPQGDFSRMEEQKPWPRLRIEISKLFRSAFSMVR